MTSRRSSRPPQRSDSPVLPRGATLPQPDLVRWIVRGTLCAAAIVVVLFPPVLEWAHTQLAGQQGVEDPITPLVATTVLTVLTPQLVLACGAVGATGACVMLSEIVLGICGALVQRSRTPRIPITYLSVRGSQPGLGSGGGRGGTAVPNGDQFFRAIQQAIPQGSASWRFRGTAPWVALTLTGVPDRPVEMGVVIADPDARRRAETAMAVRAVLQGQLPGVQVDTEADPLHASLAPEVALAWREYGLKLPPHYPLRFLSDVAGSDLLGPLAAALAPRGTRVTELQLIVRPAASQALHTGWRGRAMALLLTLQAKGDYALAEDTRAVEAKLAAVPFETTLRVVAAAEGLEAQVQLDTALNQIAEVLGQYHQRTSHHLQTLAQVGAGAAILGAEGRVLAVHTRAPRVEPPIEMVLPVRLWRAPDILTSIELAGLWHPPSPALGSLVRWLPCQILPAPPHAFIEPGRTDRITVGRARRADGTVVPVGPALRDLRPPMHITAGMGAGKSRALANIAAQCVPHGFVLLDGKGDDQGGSLAATVQALVPLADERRLVIFDVLDTDWPTALNPLAGIELARPGARDQALGQIMAIFARLDPATWGRAPAMKEFVQMATLLVLEGEEYPTLAHVKQCLLDGEYRERLVPHCTNPDVLTFWTVTFPEQGEQQRSSLHALLRRFSQLLTTETTRYLVSQPVSRLNLHQAIEDKLIVLVPLPHVTLGDLASAVGMLVLQQFVRSAFARGGTDQTRHTYPLIIDELQVFIGKDGDGTDIQNAITQLRALGIAGIYAHQTLSQLGELRDEMLTNAGSRLILRTQEPDASVYARLYAASGISAADIAGQDANEHQYAVLQCDGERTDLFSMAVLPWPAPLDVPVDTYHGPDWQTLLPPDSPDPAADLELMRLVYGPQAHRASSVQLLAEADDAQWLQIQERWEAIRACHRQHIIDHPGCIAVDERITDPDPTAQAAKRRAQQRRDRQRWLSRLLVATPHVLAAAEYSRIRRQIEPEAGGVEPARRSRTQRSFVPATVSVVSGEGTGATLPQTRHEAVVPIGYVSGATPQAGAVVAAPRIADEKTVAAAIAARGRRRAADDVADGFDDLTTPGDDEG